jgi:hypothetical protein
MNNSKKLGVLIFVVGAFVVGLTKPFTGLAPEGHYIISVTLISLALWIFKTDSIPYIAGVFSSLRDVSSLNCPLLPLQPGTQVLRYGY